MMRGPRMERLRDARSAATPVVHPLPANGQAKLSAFLDLLAKWNRVYNLTAICDRRQMESHHVSDALAVLPYLPDAPDLRLLDVGSGGGIPGLPLAIARPDWQVVLLDANGKKVTFLTQAAIELGLTNVRAVTSRIEEYTAEARFDVVISRAFSDLRTFVEAALPRVADDGLIVAMKGVFPHGEIDALPGDVAVVGTPTLDVPGLDAQRHLVIMRPVRSEPA